ncbi:MAG TPA: sigma-70 family RNA polymerase sigma factor, partial [Rubrobacteraceae bacterium]|nr:sigma-70 family RNA polymerase sigma factor [Rubrobacteraceae bacterium]
RKGRSGAWKELLGKYERLVYSIPLRYGLSRHDAADIAQLTFTILIQNLDTLPEDSRLGAWLSTVARRHTWRLLESSRRESASGRLESMDLNGSAVLLGRSDSETIEHWELSEYLDNGLSQLGKQCQELLRALYFQPERPSYAEISAQLGLPLGSIGPTRARCLKRLREKLGS